MILTIQLDDPPAVARSQKGILGDIAARVLPNYTTAQVYEGLGDALRAGLASQGINATVRVVNDAPAEFEPPSPARDLIPLAVGAAVGYLFSKE